MGGREREGGAVVSLGNIQTCDEAVPTLRSGGRPGDETAGL